MSGNTKKWAVRFIDFTSVALPVLLGLGYVATGFIFGAYDRSYDMYSSQTENNQLVAAGMGLLVAAGLQPLKSKKRFQLSLVIASLALLVAIGLQGQEDSIVICIVYMAVISSLYFLKKRLSR